MRSVTGPVSMRGPCLLTNRMTRFHESREERGFGRRYAGRPKRASDGMNERRDSPKAPGARFSLLNSRSVGYDDVMKRPFAHMNFRSSSAAGRAMTGRHAVPNRGII